MRPTPVVLTAFLLAFIAACGSSHSEVDEIFDEYEQQQKESAFRNKVRNGFKAAVTDVANITFEAIGAALASTTSTAPRFRPLVDTEVKIGQSKKLVSGGTIELAGSVTERKSSDIDVVKVWPTLNVTFTDMVASFVDENGKSGKAVLTGVGKINGTMNVASDKSFSLEYVFAGSFSVDGREVSFDVMLSYSGASTMSLSGSVNDELLNESVLIR